MTFGPVWPNMEMDRVFRADFGTDFERDFTIVILCNWSSIMFHVEIQILSSLNQVWALERSKIFSFNHEQNY